MTKPSLLVTGAAGHLGRRVVELLLARGETVIATTRRPEALSDLAARGVEVRAADFEKPASLPAAFRGARRALLVSTDAIDRPGRRLAQQRAAVGALVEAGVEHVVYTSIPDAPRSSIPIAADHAGTEAALAATRLDYTFLRNNIYMDLWLYELPGALASGQLIDARGSGAAAFVTREDCARVAAAALAGTTGGRTILDVTGPAALTADQVAAITSEVAGRPVRHVDVPLPALLDGMVQHGMPRPVAEIYAAFHTATAHGELARVSDTVERFTGERPQDLASFLLANRSALLPK